MGVGLPAAVLTRPGAAITAGALAFALGGGIPALAAAPAYARDCGSSGLLSSVTNTVCTVTGAVTDTVDSATGGGVAPVTSAADSAVSTVTDTAGDVGSTPSPSSKQTPAGVTETVVSTVTETVGATCLPVVASASCEAAEAPVQKKPDPRRSTGTLPTEPPRPRPVDPPQNHPLQLGQDPYEPEGKMRVDVDQAGLPLLIPGQFVPGLSELQGRPVRPRQAYDTLATTLTAVLLLSAVLATRALSLRRQREGLEASDALPLSGLPLNPLNRGRHRLVA